MPDTTYSLMIHGGAGQVANKASTLTSIRKVLDEGQKILESGGSALDAVTHCTVLLEDDPLFNAGRGSVLNHEGDIDLDAGIMSGKRLSAGAIASVRGVKNPIKLARTVMEKSEHVFLVGHGAEAFARTQSIEFEEPEYFSTDERVRQWEKVKNDDMHILEQVELLGGEKKFGTVGAVARDKQGQLAAATSTGGVVNKQFGRVGDTPVIGGGVYAEDGVCAVSATGHGERFLRTVLAKHIADIIRYEKQDATCAAVHGIGYLVNTVRGLGGVIVIDSDGNCGKAYSTPGMIYGSVREGEKPLAALQ
jgi:L-asparaginase / beta-aspartyl-peptidase